MTNALVSRVSATELTKRRSGLLRTGLVIALFVASIAAPVEGATITVTNTNDAGAGSLRAALAAAAAGDTINFSLSGCPCTITLTSGELAITNGVTIVGSGAATLTISGNNAFRIFNVTAATAVSISGMTLRNGKPVGGSAGGGAILLNTGATAAAFNLTDATITNNDVTLAGNPLGGGIDNEGATVTITRSAIVNNVATFRGGAIQNQGFGSMTIVNSTIASNTAGATGIGGGIRSLLPVTLTNSTIFGNSAQSAGNVSRLGGTLDFQNTIIAGGFLVGVGGAGPDIQGTGFNSLDYNLIQDPTSGTFTGTTTHNITGVSPLLGPLQNNGGPTPTLAPLVGSVVIDAGSFAAGVTVDQRGLTRPVDLPGIVNAAGGNGSDIGAVESQSVPLPLTPVPPSFLLLLTGLGGTAWWWLWRSRATPKGLEMAP